jgi:ribosomal protein S6E (S10)
MKWKLFECVLGNLEMPVIIKYRFFIVRRTRKSVLTGFSGNSYWCPGKSFLSIPAFWKDKMHRATDLKICKLDEHFVFSRPTKSGESSSTASERTAKISQFSPYRAAFENFVQVVNGRVCTHSYESWKFKVLGSNSTKGVPIGFTLSLPKHMQFLVSRIGDAAFIWKVFEQERGSLLF